MVGDVVLGAALGVTEDRVSLVNLVESVRIAAFLVVGMKALGEEPIDTVDRIGLRVRADLQNLVIIRLPGVRHVHLAACLSAVGPERFGV